MRKDEIKPNLAVLCDNDPRPTHLVCLASPRLVSHPRNHAPTHTRHTRHTHTNTRPHDTRRTRHTATRHTRHARTQVVRRHYNFLCLVFDFYSFPGRHLKLLQMLVLVLRCICILLPYCPSPTALPSAGNFASYPS